MISTLSEEMAEHLARRGWWESLDVVSLTLCEQILSEAKRRQKEDLFHEAGVGKGVRKKVIKDIRRDEIFWIENWKVEPFSGYREVLENIQFHLKRELFLPIKRFEGHIAHYAPGAFYKRHIDQHSMQPHRLISAVLYLNDVLNGGELVLYDGKKAKGTVVPKQGKLVLFESSIPHEVKPTLDSRYSLTCWFRDDII